MLLQGENLTKSYGGLMAVHDAAFHVNEGEILGLIGPNGAGKTTLFNLISGAVEATSGEIMFKNENITGMKPHQICKKGIARTFQSSKLFNGMSVFENVFMSIKFGQMKTTPDAEATKRTLELLEFVSLLHERNTTVRDLSIGLQKRVEIARSLATNPDLLLLDEVMAGLNPSEVDTSMELISKIRDQGITIFMIEHVMKAIMSVCDRIVVFHNGTNLVEGSPEDISSNPTVIKIYLGE